MKTHYITKDEVNSNNLYIGPDLSDFDGNIETQENLGDVVFNGDLVAKGYILFRNLSGIRASGKVRSDLSIYSGRGIDAIDIQAGRIESYWGIHANNRIVAHEIKAGGPVIAINEIKVKKDIRAEGEVFAKTISARNVYTSNEKYFYRRFERKPMVVCENLVQGTKVYDKLVILTIKNS